MDRQLMRYFLNIITFISFLASSMTSIAVETPTQTAQMQTPIEGSAIYHSIQENKPLTHPTIENNFDSHRHS